MDLFSIGRAIVALAAVLALLWWLKSRLENGKKLRPAPTSDALTVLRRQTLGRRASLVVVDHGGRRLLLGVTDQQVNVLSDTDIPEQPEFTLDVDISGHDLTTDKPASHGSLRGAVLSLGARMRPAEAVRQDLEQ
ncbi:flagellar biosynthetic protein FliO [Agromyces sp. NPDC057679]|uniref:flagellar biosynthetic protein FliO n=1 Tax=Agromyces sp. NPDC057679 TaxID=3346207 RepID=UPI00366F8BF4